MSMAGSLRVSPDRLARTLRLLQVEKEMRIDELQLSDKFIASAIDEAVKNPEGQLLYSLRLASSSLPNELSGDDGNPVLRFHPYIRAQLVVTLAAELEDFFERLLTSVFVTYPEKIGKTELTIGDILEVGDARSVIGQAASKRAKEIMRLRPSEYRHQLEKELSLPQNLLDKVWPSYVELQARRDAGMHNKWRADHHYCHKVSEVGLKAERGSFLTVSERYFSDALMMSQELVKTIISHCLKRWPYRDSDSW